MNFRTVVDYLSANEIDRLLLADAIHSAECDLDRVSESEVTLEDIWNRALSECKTFRSYEGQG